MSFGLRSEPGHVELERAEDLGEAAHADAADADEVRAPHAPAEHQPTSTSLRSRSCAMVARRLGATCVPCAPGARRSATCGVSSSSSERTSATRRGSVRLLLPEPHARPRARVRRGVLRLVVVGRVRERDEERRPPDRRDLGDGPRPGPGDDEVGPPEVVRERPSRTGRRARLRPLPGRTPPARSRRVPLARLVHDEQPAAQARDATERLREPLVERLGPLAAAEHEHPRQVGRGGPARANPARSGTPERRTRAPERSGARAVEGEVDAPRQRGEEAVREPHDAVGLHDRDGDPQPRGRERDGPCRVPADADDRRGGHAGAGSRWRVRARDRR